MSRNISGLFLVGFLILVSVFVTFQHANVHSIISSLRDAQHHIQAFFDFTFALLTTCQQLLQIPQKSVYLYISILYSFYVSDS